MTAVSAEVLGVLDQVLRPHLDISEIRFAVACGHGIFRSHGDCVVGGSQRGRHSEG